MSARAQGVAVIGLDAATFTVIDPLVAEGQLPHIARVLAEGSSGVLRSTTHPLTPVAWTTMVTGVNAGRHGIWDFSARDASGHHVRLVNGSHRTAAAVWDYASTAGRRVGLFNVPFSWPAPAVDGFAVSGLDASARADRAVFPDSLADELRRTFGPLADDHSFPLTPTGAVDIDRVRKVCSQRCDVLEWLVERFDPELLFVVFMSADHVHHLAWPDWERRGAESVVADVYRILDEAVGRIRAIPALAEHATMIVSDHGGGALDGVVDLNAWLASEGLLTWRSGIGHAHPTGLGRQAMSAAYRAQRALPAAMRDRLKRAAPGMRERALELREVSAIDWSRTKAFAYGAFGNLVVNVRGRESHGIVGEAEYESVRDDLISRALQLTGPDGRKIVAAVHRREDLFSGPELARLPDLIVEFADYAWLGKAPLHEPSSEIWTEIRVGPGGCAPYVGSHRHEGVVALSGPSCRQGVTLAAAIEDVCPTILQLLEAPAPHDLDGRPLLEALEREPVAAGSFAPLATAHVSYTDEAGDEVSARLRDLGYLE
ncbi:MAG TPA: alkaline phosphatase family protein [Gaiellaceae bacterium]|nr:alkaline phosphatase family protein [Gaiellaceae bacterium]